jgi:hypothetical protein
LPDHVGVAFELIADCGPNEIGSVRVEAVVYHQVDLAEVDVAEIDRNLLAVTGPWSDLVHIFGHNLPSIRHPSGWHMDVGGSLSRGKAQLDCAWGSKAWFTAL